MRKSFLASARMNFIETMIIVNLVVVLMLFGCNQSGKSNLNYATTTPKGEGLLMKISSSSFSDNGRIPTKYANTGVAGGMNISPQLSWEEAPIGTKSFALAMIDISANSWIHWLVVDLPPSSTMLPEGISGSPSIGGGGKELTNSFGKAGYGGPQPPPGSGEHKYVTTIYALDSTKLDLLGSATYQEFINTVRDKTLAKISYTGIFSR